MSDTIDTPRVSAQIDTAVLNDLTVFAAVSERETHEALKAAFDEMEGAVFEFAPTGMMPVAALKTQQRSPDAFFFEARDEEQASNWLQALRASPGGYYRHVVVLANAISPFWNSPPENNTD